jgi:hypothetical protein
MALIGAFQDTGADTAGVKIPFSVTETPATFDVGDIPTGLFIDAFVVIIRDPGVAGTIIKFKDQENNYLQNQEGTDIYAKATLQRRILTLNINMEVSQWIADHANLTGETKLTITAHIEGYTGANTVAGVLIKKLLYLEEEE